MLDSWLLTPAAAIGLLVCLAGWLAQWVRHRRHLQQAAQDHRRYYRLSCRLGGCVWELHHYLVDQVEPQTDVPEPIVGHVVYLFALRQESDDHASRVGRHSVRLHWPDSYLPHWTSTAKRCELAMEHLQILGESLAQAGRLYEMGVAAALQSGGFKTDQLAAPVALLDEASASELVRLRSRFDGSFRAAAEICRLRGWAVTMYEAKWPVRISELPDSASELYLGEVKPMLDRARIATDRACRRSLAACVDAAVAPYPAPAKNPRLTAPGHNLPQDRELGRRRVLAELRAARRRICEIESEQRPSRRPGAGGPAILAESAATCTVRSAITAASTVRLSPPGR